MKRGRYIKWWHIGFLLMLNVTILTGCDAIDSMQRTQDIYSELVLQNKTVINFSDWFRTQEGKVINDLTLEAKNRMLQEMRKTIYL